MARGEIKSGLLAGVKYVLGLLRLTLIILSIALGSVFAMTLVMVFVCVLGIICATLIVALTPIAIATKGFWLGWLKTGPANSNGTKKTDTTSERPNGPTNPNMRS